MTWVSMPAWLSKQCMQLSPIWSEINADSSCTPSIFLKTRIICSLVPRPEAEHGNEARAKCAAYWCGGARRPPTAITTLMSFEDGCQEHNCSDTLELVGLRTLRWGDGPMGVVRVPCCSVLLWKYHPPGVCVAEDSSRG